MKNLIAVTAALVAVAAFAADPKPGPRVPAADIKWEQPMGPTGPSVSFVVGDMKAKGPVEYFMKVAPGFESGWHTHNSAYGAVVIKGTMTAQTQGEAAEVMLPAGSYFGEASKVNHRNSCTKDSECIAYGRSEKGFSFNPMTPEGKPMPMPKPGEGEKMGDKMGEKKGADMGEKKGADMGEKKGEMKK
jgi:quercetin dioxygenase-like cupin family protein